MFFSSTKNRISELESLLEQERYQSQQRVAALEAELYQAQQATQVTSDNDYCSELLSYQLRGGDMLGSIREGLAESAASLIDERRNLKEVDTLFSDTRSALSRLNERALVINDEASSSMEAANVLLSVDEAQRILSAVQKGLRLSLIDNNNAVTSLAETMSIDANVPTTLNGKELFAIDNLIDNLRAHLLMTSKQAFVECLEVLNTGLTEQHFEDEEACLARAKRVLIEFRKYKNAA